MVATLQEGSNDPCAATSIEHGQHLEGLAFWRVRDDVWSCDGEPDCPRREIRAAKTRMRQIISDDANRGKDRVDSAVRRVRVIGCDVLRNRFDIGESCGMKLISRHFGLRRRIRYPSSPWIGSTRPLANSSNRRSRIPANLLRYRITGSSKRPAAVLPVACAISRVWS